MSEKTSRRSFVQDSAEGIFLGAGTAAFLSGLPAVSAADAQLKPDLVAFDDNIEPLVRLIEETPRGKLLEEIADRIRKGRTYRDVLAALLLAGIRNVQPRPSVGFKFHCVLVVNSCHLASLAGPEQDRWLPLFWALDYFKSSQADEAKRSGWRMSAVRESLVPDKARAVSMFVDGMNNWDEEKADAATAGLVRTTSADEIFNLFAQYAARDYRSIGHKAIYLANSWRTLQVIGWKFAEPVLRSLTFALLNHSGESNPANSNHAADRPWRENKQLLERIPETWLSGRVDDAVPGHLFNAFRNSDPQSAAIVAADALARGAGPASVWDGVFVGAGELLMRQPGIIGLHGLTTANAMHYLWTHAADEPLRQRLLLQACSFNPMFRESARSRGKLADRTIESLKPTGTKATSEVLTEILHDISSDRLSAAEKTLSFLTHGGKGEDFVTATRQMIFLKGRDAHDYKFSSAVLEDYAHVSPAWRKQFLALSVFNLRGSGDPNNGLIDRARSAIGA